MTQDERIGLLHGFMQLPAAGTSPGVTAMIGRVRGVPRLGVPDLSETDGSLGVVNPMQSRPGDVATALPSGLAMAASFDPALANAAGAMIGGEARAKGFNVLLAGGVNLARDPRGGRNFEYLGEDPLLAGQMAGAIISGIQSAGVVSTIKHYAVNAQETQRHTADSQMSEAALRESDLLAFEIAIERGHPGAVMCAYNKVNGAYSCDSDHLLNQVLKRDWNFPGWVMSDWGAVYGADSFSAGLDQESGEQLDSQIWFDRPLRAELSAGHVTQARLSDAVRRILRSLYAVGGDRPASVSPIDYGAHAEMAQKIEEAGIVLLKNDGILPLSDIAKSILIVGGHADIGVLSGGGSSQVTPEGAPAKAVEAESPGFPLGFIKELYIPSAPLHELRKNLPHARIDFDSGDDLKRAALRAAQSDIVIVFATKFQTEGFDSGSLSLLCGQDALIAAVAAANSRTIVVLETGNPITMPWLPSIGAVLEAWYPGQAGGAAIANVLTGAVNPSGHLPMTFPASLMQTPRPDLPGLGLPPGSPTDVPYTEGALVGYRWFAAHGQTSLFPFGYGQSYTSFRYGTPVLSGLAQVTAHVAIGNDGKRDGVGLVQLYLVEAAGKKVRRLAGFQRVQLAAGETRDVALSVDSRLLSEWSPSGWDRKPGIYRFSAGMSAADLGAAASIRLGP